MPPRSKNGSTINSQVSRMTREGGGRVAPCLRQRISHTASTSAMTTTGGMTRAATAALCASRRSARGGRFGAPSERIFAFPVARASCAGSAIAISNFFSGMVIERSPDLGALDRLALQIRERIFRIEDLAVEEGFLAARLR